jgi:hypothetical protein
MSSLSDPNALDESPSPDKKSKKEESYERRMERLFMEEKQKSSEPKQINT